jgi:nitroimidazol reductase NimA-like FMN-containing flavoprotein (pyridoxamine 5'-phosphate oxidase superfamily)
MQDSGRYGDVSMTHEELMEFLDGAEQCILATLRRDGSPFPTPLGFSCDGECFYVSFGHERAAVARLRRDPRVGITVPSWPAYPTKFVIAEGIAEEIADEDHSISKAVNWRGDPDKWAKRGIDKERFFANWISIGRVVFRIRVTNLITFDMTKLPAEQTYTVGVAFPGEKVVAPGI